MFAKEFSYRREVKPEFWSDLARGAVYERIRIVGTDVRIATVQSQNSSIFLDRANVLSLPYEMLTSVSGHDFCACVLSKVVNDIVPGR